MIGRITRQIQHVDGVEIQHRLQAVVIILRVTYQSGTAIGTYQDIFARRRRSVPLVFAVIANIRIRRVAEDLSYQHMNGQYTIAILIG